MSSGKLTPIQRELIIEWMNSLSDPFTVEDLKQQFDVHHMTAYRWMRELETDRVVVRHPFRKVRSIQYTMAPDFATNDIDPEAAAIQVRFGNNSIQLSEFVQALGSDGRMRTVGGILEYLFVRSYYADSPDHQHLRGTITTADARTIVINQLTDMRRLCDAVEQLIAYTSVWREGGDLSRRFGPLVKQLVDYQAMAENLNKMWITQHSEEGEDD